MKTNPTFSKTRRAVKALLLAFFTLLSATTMRGQGINYTDLPYECGFENGMDGWTLVNSYNSQITSLKHHSGDYSFLFFCNDGPQYLISPPFNCTEALKVSFYHLNDFQPIPTFSVGYSTTTNDPADFIWGDEITASYMVWDLYESASLPAETRYVAIKYDHSGPMSDYWLYLDDFAFEYTATRPSNLTACELTEHGATLSWTVPNASGTSYVYQYKRASDEVWSAETTVSATSVTINGLTANTSYDFRVKALYANGYVSLYASTSFLTEGEMETLPHFQGFENGMGGWRVVDGYRNTGIFSNGYSFSYQYIYSGRRSFEFDYGNHIPPQYLISPQFDGSSAMTFSFYYINYTQNNYSYIATFQVGYSTTTKDLDAFTWGDTITSSHQWQQYVNDFPEGTKYVAIKKIGGYVLYLDNINIIGPCPTPTNLGVSVDETNVTVSWSSTANGTYQICLNDDNYVESYGHDYTYTDLVPFDTYTVKVRSHCYSNYTTEWSEWSDPLTFTFEPTCPTPSNLHVSVNGTDATVSWSGDAGAWQLYFNDDGNYIEVNEPTYTYIGLEPNTTYTVKVRSHCLGSNYIGEWSGWTNPVTFSLPACPTPSNLSFSVSQSGTEATVSWSSDADAWQLCFNDDNYIEVNEPFYTFTGLEPFTTYTVKVRSHCLGNCNFDEWSEWTTPLTITPKRMLTLANDADNREAISEANGKLCDVILAGRTLYGDGSWNTLCLPFDLNDFNGTPLEGATVKTLASSTCSNNILTMNSTDNLTAIEAGKPYIVKLDAASGADLVIRSTADWNAFAANVANGNTYSGQLVKLAADISVTTMVGTTSTQFKGTFDGCGHTLTINYSSSTCEFCAPFRYVKLATIKNLRVAGTINNSCSYSVDGVASVVAECYDGCTIQNCRSSVTLTSDTNGDHFSGFIARVSNGASVTISNCLFDGKFLFFDGVSVFESGGFVGWAEGFYFDPEEFPDPGTMPSTTSVNISNCLFAPTEVISGGIDNVGTFCFAEDMNLVTLTNCYYTRSFGDAQGTYTSATGAALQALLGDDWEVRNGEVVPKIHITTGNIHNPMFTNVIVSSATTNITTPYAEFIGSYAPFGNNDLLFDAHNPNGSAQHAALGKSASATPIGYYPAEWYTDAELTTPATSIPFDENGNVTLYVDGWRPILTLANDTDNNAAISETEGQLYDVVLADRTLYRDGSWNTLCLPFNLNDFNNTPLEGATVKTLANSAYNDGMLTMNFTDDIEAIEAGKPYIVKWNPFADPDLVIHSAAEWDAFATNVNNGTSYQGQIVRLAADISVTTMVGTNEHPFSGTFDGYGHTLTINLNGTQEYQAPFRFVDGATICNLKIAGNITNTRKFAAGLVGYMQGISSIARCISNVTINSTVNGDGTHGGFIANLQYGATTITDCVFNGKFLGPNTTHCGGFVGWTESNYGATLAITNCLFAPTQITISGTGGNTFSRARNMSSVTITNSYFTQAFGGAQGIYTTATGTTLQTLLGDGWEVRNGEVVPKMMIQNLIENIVNPMFTDVTISSATANVTTDYADFIGSYAPFSNNGVLFDAHNPNGDAQHAALSIGEIDTPTGNTLTSWFTDAELTTYATAIPFADDGTVTLYAKSWPGEGDECTINNTWEWNLFCDALQDNDTYDHFIGKTVKLGADISVTRMAGSSGHEFMGTFDGQGHTLTVSYQNNDGTVRTAPFSYVNGATIQNLIVAGSITGTASRAAGIVGETGSILSHVTNCVSSVNISGGSYTGGISVGGKVEITGCVFNGTITGTSMSGGFVGWSTSSLVISGCLFAPQEGSSIVGGTFYYNGGGEITPINSYYTVPLGTPQGKQAYSITSGENVTLTFNGQATAYDISGISAYSVGMVYGNTFYAGNGDVVSLNIGYIDQIGYTPPSGYVCCYQASAGTLTGTANPYTLTMPAEDVSITATWIPDPMHFEHTGTNEYTIHTATGWDFFCDALQDNDTYNRFIGKTVKLGTDISVTRMAGGSGHEFGGTFDGQSYTLTVSYQNTDDDVRTAPFSYINGATIQNLIVAGNITGTAIRAAGIVGETGNILSYVTNCISSVNISGDSFTGGISVGGKVEITGCVFNGTITGTSMSGGFVGYSNNALVIRDCLFAPQEGSTIAGGTFYYNGGGNITPINSYYTVPLGTPQGKQARSIAAGENVTVAFSGQVTAYDISGISAYSTGMVYGNTLYAGEGDMVSLNLGGKPGYLCSDFAASAGTLNGTANPYTLTMPAEDVSITATWIPDPMHFEQTGTDEYTIHTATGWDLFCEALQDNDTYNRFIDKTVKLGADISVTRMAGGSYHDFMGTFDGQGHTLTVSYGSASSPIADDKAAPFVNVEVGCIIKNLHVAGDIYTSAKYAGGLVGTQYGAVGIENCHISTIIHSSTEGDGTHGGIVGLNGGGSSSSLTITGCLFDGKLLTTGTTTNCGGFVGWRNGTCTIVNSLYAPAAIAEGESEITNGSATFVRNGATALTNSYYTRTLGTEQGFPAISNPAITPVGEPTGTYPLSSLTAYVNGLMYGETFYYHPERNFQLTIAGHGTGSGGWNLLASPVADTLSPTPANGFLTNAYDLYRFNPTHEDNEWENYKADSFTLENGRGYLYANSGDVTLNFGGVPIAGNTYEITLAYDADDIQKCWNLVGNPFTCNAYLDREYYVLRSDGLGINPVAIPATTPIPPFTAVFVKAVGVGDTAVFTKVTQ